MGNFARQVLEIVARIPEGKVTTYGVIARALGNPRGARVVVWALWSGPSGLELPYHRVVNSKGQLAPPHIFGEGVQRECLLREGVTFLPDGRVDLERHLWIPEIEEP
ncbi:MAG: MGMT family protein [Caldiserica bacterium]|jgi:methylated-DNA-protein-cysteine methyltransferase-like protein|nr:MGMT family protein [Caldisericota bacterium]